MKRRNRQPRTPRLQHCPVQHCTWSREEKDSFCATHWEQLPKELRLRLMRAKDPVTKASLEREALGILERLARPLVSPIATPTPDPVHTPPTPSESP